MQIANTADNSTILHQILIRIVPRMIHNNNADLEIFASSFSADAMRHKN